MTEKPKDLKYRDCTCDDWIEGTAQIEAHAWLALMHHGRPYTAARFRFCPWCSTSLVIPFEDEDKEEEE